MITAAKQQNNGVMHMDINLDTVEGRVLGCLMEKEMSTPEYYPLSLNALVNACNQKSNRDPVISHDESTIIQAVAGLKDKQLVWQSNVSRVPKYEEHFIKDSNFTYRQASVLSELLLRGPQTPGELKSRTERMYAFESLEEVNETLENLESLGFIVRLERRPGRKEARCMHLLCGQPAEAGEPTPEPVLQAEADDRIGVLEQQVEALQQELSELKETFTAFKKEFE